MSQKCPQAPRQRRPDPAPAPQVELDEPVGEALDAMLRALAAVLVRAAMKECE